jgi:hypothetical protein
MSSLHIALLTNGVNAPGGGSALLSPIPIGAQIVNAIVLTSPGGAVPPAGADVSSFFSIPMLVPAASNISVGGSVVGSSEVVLLQGAGTSLSGATILILFSTP